ncbi:LCP family protein [Brochothrix thermosphacta]|nr:LCP family protein [Brochothrix thermosphacta]MDO7864165.1 LCP family protein [Brochothrix thermosphacta]
MNKKKAPSKTKSKSKKGLLKKILIPLLLLLLVIGGIAGYMYYKAADTVDKINEPLKTTSTKVVDEKPFTVLLMGIGTQPSNAKRQLRGASDTMVLATVNPSKNEMNLLSIPRDMITPISGESKKGKISTAYTIGGAQKSVDTVSDLFDVSIDHYVTLNMDGLEQLVDAVDGVTVKNTFEFTQDGFNFPKGSLTLSGEKALSYSLMRYNDPNDDFGRQKRQRQTVDALFVKLVSAKGLMN